MKIARTAKWAVRAGAAALIFTLVAMLFVVIMTMFGPVSLSFLSGRLETMVNAELAGFQVKFKDTTLEWSQRSGRVNLTMVDATVVDAGGAVLAQSPRVSIALSAGALLQGRAVPRWITLDKPSARLVRTADGGLQFGLVASRQHGGAPNASETQDGGVQTELFDRVLDILRHPEKGGDLSRRLEGVAITDASLDVVDELTGARWAAERAQIEVSRNDGRLKAELVARAVLPGGVEWPIEVTADLPQDGDAFDIRVRTGDIAPASLAAAPGFGNLAPLRFPVRVQAHFLYGKDGLPGPVQVWLTAGPGQLTFPGWKAAPGVFGGADATILFDANTMRGALQRLTLRGESSGDVNGNFAIVKTESGANALDVDLRARGVSLRLPAVFDRTLRLDAAAFNGRIGGAEIRIRRAALALNAFRIAVSGAIASHPVSPAVTLDGSFTGLTLADLKTVWPLFAAPNARAWVTGQMKAGTLPSGAIKVALPAGAIVDNIIPDEALAISFAFTGLTADYLDGLPPLVNARGSAILRGDTFEVSSDEGIVGPLKLRNAKVLIPQLHLVGTVAAISGDVSGSMKDILTLLDAPRLGYPKRFGIKPDAVKGSADVSFTFTVPALKDVKAEEVGIKVTGKTRDLAVRLSDSIAIDSANLVVDITGDGLSATGATRVNEVPMNLTWNESFKPQGRPSTTIEAVAVLDNDMRRKIGLEFETYVQGPVGVNAGFSGSGANLNMATIMLDFDRARISAPELNWAIGPGNKVVATSKLAIKPRGVFVLDDLRAVGGEVSVAGRLIVDRMGIRDAAFERVRLGPLNDFAIVAKLPEIGEQKYVVNGRAIDASELIAGMDGGTSRLEAKDMLKKPYNISATVQHVTLRGDATLRDVIFRHQTDGIRIRALDVSANYPGGGSLRADMVNLTDGQRRLRIATTDAGKLVRAMTGFRSILGGKMTLHADLPRLPTPADAAFVSDPMPRYAGAVKIENFKVINQPFLARLFAAGSFTGLGDLLDGEGIGFGKLNSAFVGQGDVVKVMEGQASGTSVGVTFQGRVDRKSGAVAFDGTLVPLYGLNSLLEDIPLVGDILTSRKGEGIIGLTYEVAGRTDDLDIMVNPLSALTPGIFRRIFQAGKYPDENPRAPGAQQSPAPRPSLRPPEPVIR